MPCADASHALCRSLTSPSHPSPPPPGAYAGRRVHWSSSMHPSWRRRWRCCAPSSTGGWPSGNPRVGCCNVQGLQGQHCKGHPDSTAAMARIGGYVSLLLPQGPLGIVTAQPLPSSRVRPAAITPAFRRRWHNKEVRVKRLLRGMGGRRDGQVAAQAFLWRRWVAPLPLLPPLPLLLLPLPPWLPAHPLAACSRWRVLGTRWVEVAHRATPAARGWAQACNRRAHSLWWAHYSSGCDGAS
jgi:hypothetical protein